jgi:hypothetical protein
MMYRTPSPLSSLHLTRRCKLRYRYVSLVAALRWNPSGELLKKPFRDDEKYVTVPSLLLFVTEIVTNMIGRHVAGAIELHVGLS